MTLRPRKPALSLLAGMLLLAPPALAGRTPDGDEAEDDEIRQLETAHEVWTGDFDAHEAQKKARQDVTAGERGTTP